MNTIVKTAFAAVLLLAAAPVFAEDAHHPTSTETPAAGSVPEAAAPAPPAPSAGSATMMGGGMMGGDMMEMMKQMMGRHAGSMRGMMSTEAMADGGPMAMMMSPERIEGRIAFLRTEMNVTEAQQPLWEAVAEALRANAAASQDLRSGMMQSDISQTLPRRLADRESLLSARLDGLRNLKGAIEPFYAALDETQKAAADELLMPMGMM